MGYHISQRATVFKILAGKQEDARKAVLTLLGKETITDDSGRHFSWVDHDWHEKKTLVEMLTCWRWEVALDDEGNIRDIYFTGEKYGDDEILFRMLAPFVESGCYIEMQGEKGEIWRWVFEDGSLYEREAIIDFGGDTHSLELLSILERLLSITEPIKDNLDPKDRAIWLMISAKVADIRERKVVV